MPHELPSQAVNKEPEEQNTIVRSQTENSTDPDYHQSTSSDPLLDFLEKRKKLRFQFEHRYSKKAIGITAYLRQRNSPHTPIIYNGILLNYNPE